MFQRQIKEVQYTVLIRHITNISDFVWFQRSSMKSVSSFSSMDSNISFPIAFLSFFLLISIYQDYTAWVRITLSNCF